MVAVADESAEEGRYAKPARWLRPSTQGSGHGAGYLGAATVALSLTLLLLQAMLYVPSGWGIEDFLGWVDVRPEGPVQAMLSIWGDTRRFVAYAYLAVDDVLFVPVYSAFFLTMALVLAKALGDDAPSASPTEPTLLLFLATPALALVAADLVENAIGMAKLDAAGPWLAAAASAAAVYALWWRVRALRTVTARVPAAALAALALLAVMLALGVFSGDVCANVPAADSNNWIWRLGCGAHRAKGWLVIAVLALLLLAGAAWFFGVRLKDKAKEAIAEAASNERQMARGRLRSAVWDIPVRSRYVLVALALVAGLTIVMDQGRDVVYAVAASPFRPLAPQDEWLRILFGLGSAAVFFASGAAIWLLVYACWFWTRSVTLLVSARGVKRVGNPYATALAPEDVFAKQWARVLAVMPVIMLALLCADVIRDATVAQGTADTAWLGAVSWLGPVFVVLVFGGCTVAFGVAFLMKRSKMADLCYYDCLDWQEWSRQAGFWKADKPSEKYSFLGRVTAYGLPLLLVGGMLICRAVDALPVHWGFWEQDYVPSMSLAIVVFEITLWLCFFGWLSLLEVRQSIPWVALLVGVVGLFGLLGWTTNHLVWPGVSAEATDSIRAASLRMLFFTAMLALLLMCIYEWVMRIVRRQTSSENASGRGFQTSDAAIPVVLAVAVFALLFLADKTATMRRPLIPQPTSAAMRPTLDEALARWLNSLCDAKDSPACQSSLPRDKHGGIPVQFVSTEGGGIRAAVWTAFVLEQLANSDPHFEARTFSMSGVSGGAVGLAAFRACNTAPSAADRSACLQQFAATDLLSPLLSAWMFEDALARVLPTRWCDTPACGFLSRGVWFEQGMEAGTRALRQGLIASAQPRRDARQHVPYLLLNATWVESGERAIASDLEIHWSQFRGAKDQLGLIGNDLPLSVAAHNAARFPFINAIGAVQTTRQNCLSRLALPRDGASAATASNASDTTPETCGHLADGGYFDNSGAQSTLDLLLAFSRCLEVKEGDPDANIFPRCKEIGKAHRDWLRATLVPQVLMVRNSVNPVSAREESCPVQRDLAAPSGGQVKPQMSSGCRQLGKAGYHPDRPVCKPRTDLFIDLVGPVLTVLHVGGIGAHGQLAEARQTQGVRALRGAMGGAAEKSELVPTEVLDLMPDGTRYPLGWHLSALAVKGMLEQSASCAAVAAR